jgi:hypothetical protein
MLYSNPEQMLRAEIKRALLATDLPVVEIGATSNVFPHLSYQLLGVIEEEKSEGSRVEICTAYFKVLAHIAVDPGQSVEDEAGRVNLLVKKALKRYRPDTRYEDDDLTATVNRIKPGKFDRSLSGTKGSTDIVFPVLFTQSWK